MKRYIKFLTLLLAGVLILSAVPGAATLAAAEERTEKVIVETGAADSLQICKVGDRLYYFGAEGVMSCATDGSEPKLISKQTGTLFTDGETLFRGTQKTAAGLVRDPQPVGPVLLYGSATFIFLKTLSARQVTVEVGYIGHDI